MKRPIFFRIKPRPQINYQKIGIKFKLTHCAVRIHNECLVMSCHYAFSFAVDVVVVNILIIHQIFPVILLKVVVLFSLGIHIVVILMHTLICFPIEIFKYLLKKLVFVLDLSLILIQTWHDLVLTDEIHIYNIKAVKGNYNVLCEDNLFVTGNCRFFVVLELYIILEKF